MPSDDLQPPIRRPIIGRDTLAVALAASFVALVAMAVSFRYGLMLLYVDSISRLEIARLLAERNPVGLFALGATWPPLPQLLLIPMVSSLKLWQNGLAGALPGALYFVVATTGIFVLSLRLMPRRWALVAAACFSLNPNMLYLSTTSMSESLSAALFVWIVLATCRLLSDLDKRSLPKASAFILLGLGILAATLTRFDHWALGFVIWSLVTFKLLRDRDLLRRAAKRYAALSALALAGPVTWCAYNKLLLHDWLAFSRGPYSPMALMKREFAGTPHYFGWHNPLAALVVFLRSVQLNVSARQTGALVIALALGGAWIALRRRLDPAALLLWTPIPFYAYAVSYGWVRIGMPPTFGGWNANARYGIALLPALAVYSALALSQLEQKLPSLPRLLRPLTLALIVASSAVMLRDVPIALQDATVCSQGWHPVELDLARQFAALPAGTPILINAFSQHLIAGSLERSAIPIHQTIGPYDRTRWLKASVAPAQSAGLVVAADGDAIAAAVTAHPEGLTVVSRLCALSSPCLTVYRSDRFGLN